MRRAFWRVPPSFARERAGCVFILPALDPPREDEFGMPERAVTLSCDWYYANLCRNGSSDFLTKMRERPRGPGWDFRGRRNGMTNVRLILFEVKSDYVVTF
jgi:hypothetical protein